MCQIDLATIYEAIDASKIINELLWNPQVDIIEGLEKTVDWYLENKQWTSNILKEINLMSDSAEAIGIIKSDLMNLFLKLCI